MPLISEQDLLTHKTGKLSRGMRTEPPSPEPRLKKRCVSTDANDAAIAELLLGLSHSSRSSPRESNVSDEDFVRFSSPNSYEIASPSEEPLSARRSRRVGRQPLKFLLAESAESEEEDASEASLSGSFTFKASPKHHTGHREVPARCKCGKRVSASHPPCKSELMLLSEKFRDRFANSAGDDSSSRIDLNDCALALGVPRRRLYDITIVYEAAEGLDHLPLLVARLKREEETGQPIGDRRGNPLGTASEHQNTHSLWALSRKFIRLLLTQQGSIQLSDAAVHLIGQKPGTRPQTYLTVERRLYDIGSILSTLDLIKRTYIEGKRQPAFSWNWSRTNTAEPDTAKHEMNSCQQGLATSVLRNNAACQRPETQSASKQLQISPSSFQHQPLHATNECNPADKCPAAAEALLQQLHWPQPLQTLGRKSIEQSDMLRDHSNSPQIQTYATWPSVVQPQGFHMPYQPQSYHSSLAQSTLLHLLQHCSTSGLPSYSANKSQQP